MLKKIRLISKSGFLVSSLLNIEAMECVKNINKNEKNLKNGNNTSEVHKMLRIEHVKRERNIIIKYFYKINNDTISNLIIDKSQELIQIIYIQTEEKYRRQGFATKLLLFMFNSESILNNGIKELPEIGLDSTSIGFSLYKNLGFIEYGKKDDMGLQPMKLIWNSDIRRQYLILNNDNNIVLKNNNNEKCNFDGDLK